MKRQQLITSLHNVHLKSPTFNLSACCHKFSNFLQHIRDVQLASSAKRRRFLQQQLRIWMMFQWVTWESVPSMQCSCARVLDVLLCCQGLPANLFSLDPMSKAGVLIVE